MKKKLLIIAVVCLAIFAAMPVQAAFSDVDKDDYYYDAVNWAVLNGITHGTSASSFSPDMSCTRGQIVMFLWNAAGQPQATGINPFVDVKSDAYYYKAVLWAVGKGITAGKDANHFAPNDTCTRAQAMSFIWRYAGEPSVMNSSITNTTLTNIRNYCMINGTENNGVFLVKIDEIEFDGINSTFSMGYSAKNDNIVLISRNVTSGNISETVITINDNDDIFDVTGSESSVKSSGNTYFDMSEYSRDTHSQFEIFDYVGNESEKYMLQTGIDSGTWNSLQALKSFLRNHNISGTLYDIGFVLLDKENSSTKVSIDTKTPVDNKFQDVSKESYYATAVSWAVANQITSGIDSTHFGPDNTCTRAQIVSFLYRYLK